VEAESAPNLGPLSWRELIRAALSYYSTTFSRLAPISLALGVILFFAPLAAFGLWRGETSESLWVGIFIARESLFQLFASIIVALAGAVIAAQLLSSRRTLAEAYSGLRPRRSDLLGSALYSMLLGGFAHLVPFLGLVLPLTLLGPPVLAQVVAIEERPLAEARPRALRLFSGRMLKTFLFLLPVTLVLRLLEGVLYTAALGAASAAGWDPAALAVLQGIGSAAFMGLVMVPFLAAVMAALYFDMRARAGDLDEDALGAALT
jgi:hypothetical protein